mgnify:CR=1 FL=1
MSNAVTQKRNVNNASESSFLIEFIQLLFDVISNLLSGLKNQNEIINQLQQELKELKVKLANTQKVFSPKNEKTISSKKTRRKRGAQAGRKPRTRNIPKNLPKEKIDVDFPEIPQCSICGKSYLHVKSLDKITNQINIFISVVHQLVTRFTYKKDCKCNSQPEILTAPPVKTVIKKSILTTATLVNLIIMKYFLAVPIYRYRQFLMATGYPLSSGTVENNFKKIGILLEPVYHRMIQEVRKSKIWNADETRWKVFEHIEGKSSYLWWLWVFASQNVVLYIIDPTRSANVIKKINNQSNRIIAADRYSAYEAIKGKTVKIAYCWVHLRRDFINLKSQKILKDDPVIGKWVDDWLSAIKKIFTLNNKRLKSVSEKQFDKLTAKLYFATDKLRQKTEENVSCKFQKTILNSFKKRFSGYTLFIDDPNIPIHNNRAERLLKTGINGRKNYLGNVSKDSVSHTQIFLSIIATANNNNVSPQLWFKEYLTAIAENDSKLLKEESLELYVNKLLNPTS